MRKSLLWLIVTLVLAIHQVVQGHALFAAIASFGVGAWFVLWALERRIG